MDKKKHTNSFKYRGEYHYEEDGKYFVLRYGTKQLSISKNEFEKRKMKKDDS